MTPLSPYMIWIKIGLAVFGCALISFVTWYVVSDHYELKIADMVKLQQAQIIIKQDEAAHKQAAADKITRDEDVANAQAHQQIKTVYITQKVPTYVSAETDSRFPLSCGFVRLHDAYAANVDPAAVSLPAGLADTDKCPVAPSVAAAIIGDNYGLALGWRADLQAWQRWYDRQAALWNDALKEKPKPSLLERINPF
jgi:hypothetical protein